VGRNSIISIDKDTYSTIKYLCENGFDELKKETQISESVVATVNSLIQNGYLSSTTPIEIRHPYTDYVEDYIDNYLNTMLLQITQRCNLSCAYCPYAGNGKFDRAHSELSMNWDTAQKAIDFFLAKSTKSATITLGFYGGEPLLEYKLITKIVSYLNKYACKNNIIYQITTNGTIMNDDIIELFMKNEFNITISIDGPERLHNKNRRFSDTGEGTFSIIYANLVKLKKNGIKFAINAVWDLEEDRRDIESFLRTDEIFEDSAYEISQVDSSRINTAFNYSNATRYIEDAFRVRSIINYLFQNDALTTFQEAYIKSSLLKTAELIKERDAMPTVFHHGGTCIPGYNRLFIDISGNIFPCEKISGKSTAALIGHIHAGFNYHKIRALLNIGKLTEQECKCCWAMNLCSMCVLYADTNEAELSKKSKLNRCNELKKLIRENITQFIIVAEIIAQMKEVNH
jgi:uncharacterized protein